MKPADWHRGTDVTTLSLPRVGYSRASESAGGATTGAPASGPMTVLLGESPEIAAVRETVERLVARQADARRLSPILLEGETGVGKGLVARLIHRAGPRGNGPFVDINCAAIPETLLEAELFGFERGAFTDARQPKPGLFQTAHGGTIFLDEVGLLPDTLQAKLLKVIEERAVRRLGGTRSEAVDVSIVTATNENLEAAMHARRFREDLYHRLAVLTLRLPPLRERGEDVCLLATHFLARACADYDMPSKTLAPDARAALLAYPWPGNVRELSNVIERVVLLSDAPLVTADMLGLPRTAGAAPSRRTAPDGRAGPAAPIEAGDILEALRRTNWNVCQAAATLGISRNTLRYRMEKYGLRPGEPAPPPIAPAVSVPPTASPGSPSLPEVSSAAEPQSTRRRIALLRVVLVPADAERLPVECARHLQVFADKALSFGGRIEETSPTGIVAAFGLEPIEDAPRRAVLAAVAIQNAADRSTRCSEGCLVKVGIHIGHHTVGRTGGAPAILPDARRAAWRMLDHLVAGEPGQILIESGGRGVPRPAGLESLQPPAGA